jgi:formylglycine-generating enzyme required for sulfatase activity
LLDVVGNVEEWMADWYDADYYQDPVSNDYLTGPDYGD